MEVSVFDYVLTNVLSFLAGVFFGLGVCACHKETFLQRAKSLDSLSDIPTPLVSASPTTATFPITLK